MIRGQVFVLTDVVDWRGAPRVEVLLSGPEPTPPLVSVTGRDGSYFFLGLPPGSYYVTVNVPPFVQQTAKLTLTEDAILIQDFFLEPGP